MSHWCCACHATSRCNAHATYSLHQPPRPTLQRYQDASIDCACHQMSHWCCATASHCNAPFPAPATQSHAPTLPGCFNRLRLPPNVTLVLRLPHNVTIQRTIPCTSHTDPRCNWKCHVHKRANFTCTSEPISRVQANPRPKLHPHTNRYVALPDCDIHTYIYTYVICIDDWCAFHRSRDQKKPPTES